ncbi:MAG: bifunctional fucokinase/L-fucose-1-P-guanylyltransferase [Ruminococcus sp.]|nr:bifunctional fucokinase/L-fucose-1-P-guanylyltransferase [Ruminococcus sp.]
MKKTDYSTLFEQQSYNDSLDFYENLLSCPLDAETWDYVILTASNEAQANGYIQQIKYRLEENRLPKSTHFAVLPDPNGERVGSGGATLNAILYVKEQEKSSFDPFDKRILVIHSGGDSKRVPQYSACGKLFSPVPRTLPDGKRSTLFDEFMIAMSPVAERISSGMLVCSGDVLLLFNALQIDFYSKGAAALSIKENVMTGKNHGVYLKDEDSNVGSFLHKQSVERLREVGAVDEYDNVGIDTGAVIFDKHLLSDLCSLVEEDPKKYINERARLSFYADFLYPLASSATEEQYYKETPEGEFNDELHECRAALWNVLNKYSMKLIQLSPASFIHFGTTKELLRLMTDDMDKYRFLGWSRNIDSNAKAESFAVSNSYISRKAEIGEGSYIEDCYIHHNSTVGKNCVLSGVTLNGEAIPDNCVLHGLKLNDGRFVCRMYGVDDNPKKNKLFGKEIEDSLWESKIYPVCDTMAQAVNETLSALVSGKPVDCELTSLKDSFNNADISAILPWQIKLSDKVKTVSVLQAIDDGISVDELHFEVNPRIENYLIREAERIKDNSIEEFSLKIRIYYYLYKLSGKASYSDMCFETISQTVLESALKGTAYRADAKITKDEVVTKLPVRVNWGGAWSDTPPYCMENGGTVLNAAISLNGKLPIEVTLKRLDEKKIVLCSTDIGAYEEFTGDLSSLQNCRNPQDAFALHKAALIACGIIPYTDISSVEQICDNLGGGLYFNTRVINIPKGSGLGTSSILAGACVKGLYELTGADISSDEMYSRVLCMEQIMMTGGGWQDQVGGLAKGIKMISSRAGLEQEISCLPLDIRPETIDELNQRFCLIYTGQRRLARNLLRKVVGNYIGNNPDSIAVHYEIQKYAVLMRLELEKGNIDGFAKLLSEHWELSKKLDAGCTNTCIDHILYSINDLIDGQMICGAGGGGFLQVVLKKNVEKTELKKRLREIFRDSGVTVYDCEFTGY